VAELLRRKSCGYVAEAVTVAVRLGRLGQGLLQAIFPG